MLFQSFGFIKNKHHNRVRCTKTFFPPPLCLSPCLCIRLYLWIQCVSIVSSPPLWLQLYPPGSHDASCQAIILLLDKQLQNKNECALIFPVSALPSRRVCETAARAPSCWWTPRWFTQSRSPSTRPPSHWRPSRSPARSTWPSSPAYKHSRKIQVL